MSDKKHYAFGQWEDSAYPVSLQIDTNGLTLEQFRADIPRIIAKLESYVSEALDGNPVAPGAFGD